MSEEKNLKPVKELKEELEKVNGGTQLATSYCDVLYYCQNCKYHWIEKSDVNNLQQRCRRCNCSHHPVTGQDCIVAKIVSSSCDRELIAKFPYFAGGTTPSTNPYGK